MAKYVKISPVTRLEGHLGITTRISDVTNAVATAYSHGEMFRGLEKILVGGAMIDDNGNIRGHGRDPRDAPVITSRTCGVCHFIHRHTSLRNIENAAGWDFPAPQALDAYGNNLPWNGGPPAYAPGMSSGNVERWLDANRTMRAQGAAGAGSNPLPLGAQLARNIVHLVTYVYSHAAHTIALAGPDYKALIDNIIQGGLKIYVNGSWVDPGYIDANEKSGAQSFFDNFLQEAVVAQRILHEILGFLGGKAPHQQSAIPGGFSRSFTGPLGKGGTDMDIIAALATKTIGFAGANPSTASQTWPLLDLTPVNGIGLDERRDLLHGNDWICQRVVPFTLALAVAGVQAGAHEWGRGSDNFVCAPTFDVVRLTGAGVTGDAYFRGGVILDAGGSAVRKRLDPTREDSADIYAVKSDTPQESADDWFTIWEDITSGKYPYQDDFTTYPRCGGYKDDWTGPMDVSTWAEWKRKLKKPGYPGETETHPLVNYECPETRYVYTWYKATRVKDKDDNLYTVESGPLARLVINGLDPHLNLSGVPLSIDGGSNTLLTFSANGIRNDLSSLAGLTGWHSTTLNRLIARLQDALLLIDILIGSDYSGENKNNGYLHEIFTNGCWLTELNRVWVNPPAGTGVSAGTLGVASGSAIPASLPGPPKTYVLVQDTPPNGDWITLGKTSQPAKGCGYWDAPRGITCHFCQVVSGKLVQYQHIAGTTWNGNGRDSQGNPGPFEWSLMDYQPVTTVTSIPKKTLGKYEITGLNKPVVERSVRITYDLYDGQSYKKYVAYDVPKHDGSDEGFIKGKGIENTSYIDYKNGKIFIEFSYNYDFPDYSHVKNVKLEYYGYAGSNAVPAPASWNSATYGYGNAADTSKPNPINILRTIRSYDPCLACSIHVIDSKGRKVGKYEVIPVAGWDL